MACSLTHSHGPTGDHSHGGTAFTTWLDFSQAAQQAKAIYRVLARKLPAHQAELAENFEALEKDLMSLDEKMMDLSKKNPDHPLLASHPIYQYLARRYELNIKMLMWEPYTDPGKQEWKHFQELLTEHPAGWMIWEGDPLNSSVKQLEDINIQGVVFSPCFANPEEGDFLSVMQENIKNMEIIFK